VIPQVVCSEYTPRQHSLAFHARSQRFAIVVLHRRAGKTVMAINDLIDKAIQCQKPFPKYAYIAPFREQAKSIAWEYLKHYAAPLIDKTMESELSVLLKNGARIRLFGADNPDGLRGNYFDGVVLDEYAQIHPRLFGEVIGPALADRKGWIVFMGTPAGKNHFYELWDSAQCNENWFTQLLKASESGIIDAEELELIRTNPGTDEATYLQEMECSFTAAVRGAIWAEYIERHETTNQGVFPYDPTRPVITAFDIGHEDDTSIWFAQANGRELAIIDFFTQNHLSVDDILDILVSKGYRYSIGYLPHDAANKSFQTGKSTRELMTEAGFKTQLVPSLSVQDGIQAVRATLPNVFFNVANADVRVGLSALKTYQREWDSKTQIFRAKPKHDWSSNPADAFRYLCLAMNPTALKQASRTFNTSAPPPNAHMNLYDLFEEREARLNGSKRI
jgi:phage terminase large subunit